MGDILHALPAMTALRQAHPGWVIDWVVEPRWRALLAAENPAGHSIPQGLKSLQPLQASDGAAKATPFQINRSLTRPVIDGFHLAATRDWRKSPLSQTTLHEIRTLRQALKSGSYDVVLDLQGAIRSAAVGRMAG